MRSWLDRVTARTVPPESAYRLAEAFWPGPLTMILPQKAHRARCPHDWAGWRQSGVRCPNHPVTLADDRGGGRSHCRAVRPIPPADQAATSAADMLEDMDGKIDGIFDGGPCGVGVESTIIDLTCQPPRLLRAGGLPLEELERVLGDRPCGQMQSRSLMTDGEQSARTGHEIPPLRAEGARHRRDRRRQKQRRPISRPMRRRARVSSASRSSARSFPAASSTSFGPEGDKSEQARRVFDALREFDATDVTEIFAQCPDDAGLGLAIGNRLKKAAGFHVVEV